MNISHKDICELAEGTSESSRGEDFKRTLFVARLVGFIGADDKVSALRLCKALKLDALLASYMEQP